MFHITRIHKDQLGLLYRDGDFVGVLAPGRHLVRSKYLGPWREKLELLDVTSTRVTHSRLEFLVTQSAFREHVHVLELADHERALVWRDDRLWGFVGAGRHVFLKEPYALRFEHFDVTSGRFEHPRLAAVLAADGAANHLIRIDVPLGTELLVFRTGELVERLRKGTFAYWKSARDIVVHTVDLREQVLDVAGQEIMSRDKVSLRVNLVVTYRISDSLKSVSVTPDASQALYRAAQLVLRAAVGTREIDALLADKESVGGEVAQALAPRAAEFGITVRSVGLRDIVLPGDMKSILNQVITAQKQAEANLIRRREETAAARSQANTAKLMAANPTLVRMKELEMLEQILSGTRATFVLGKGDLVDQVRGILGNEETA